MSAYDMVLTALLAQAYYIREKKASSFEASLGLDQIEVEAVIDGEIVRDVIPVENPKFIVKE